MTYIDLHTHRYYKHKGTIILNIFAQNLDIIEEKGFISSGIHPWHINELNIEESLKSIEMALIDSKLIALGECGIDRLTDATLQKQVQVFKSQILLAEQYKKPLIIHCVRAYPELIQLKKELKPKSPWILHGYRAKSEITKSLVDQGFYFSIGESIVKDKKMKQFMHLIPTDHLFFETDESLLTIENIYSLASEILDIETEKLAELIEQNFKSIFGDDKLVTQD